MTNRNPKVPCPVCGKEIRRVTQHMNQKHRGPDGGMLFKESPCCGLEVECFFGPDPFAAEIHGDFTPGWQCSDCSHQSAMEI